MDSETDRAGRPGVTSQVVAERIREAIRSAELSAGVQIRQAEWADRLGVSRVPVREALNILRSEGLLVHKAHRGYFVLALTDDEIRQIYLLRRVVDEQIALHIEWPDEAQLEELREIESLTRAAYGARDVPRWLTENDRFIQAVYELCPLHLVVSEAVQLWRRSEVARSLRVHAIWSSPHTEAIKMSPRRILSAIELRDRDDLVSAMTRVYTAEPVIVEASAG